MKTLLFTLFFIFSFLHLDSQEVIKFKATQVQFGKNINSKWVFEEPKESSILITVDVAGEERIKIFAKETQNLDIIKEIDTDTTGNSKKGFSDEFNWRCIDNDGKECRVTLIKHITEQKYLLLIRYLYLNLGIRYYCEPK